MCLMWVGVEGIIGKRVGLGLCKGDWVLWSNNCLILGLDCFLGEVNWFGCLIWGCSVMFWRSFRESGLKEFLAFSKEITFIYEESIILLLNMEMLLLI